MIPFLAVLILTGFLVIFLSLNRKGQPPGPWVHLPVVGYLPFLGKERPELVFTKWSHSYGKIMGIQLGSFRTVILNDYTMIREAFDNPSLSGRPFIPALHEYFARGEKRGISSSDGQSWKEQRRFTMKTLTDFGFGKKSMESLIEDETKEMVNALALEAALGEPICLQQRFSLVILNTFWRIVSGERFEHDDVNLKRFLQKLTKGIQSTSNYLMFMPWLSKLQRRIFPSLDDNKDEIQEFYRKQIYNHEITFQENECRDFMDVYLKEIRQTDNLHSSFYKTKGEENLVAVAHDLFFGGSETTSVTLTWAVLYIVSHPDIQNKLQSEIDQVVGKSRLPTLQDRARMPYAICVIMETLRKSSVFPLGTFHSAMEDVEFHGYKIAKNTLIIPNIWAAHHDPNVWGDPEQFRPERFLSADGRVRRPESLLPFGSGERVCIGGALAREELFLFLTSIFQRFTLKFNPCESTPQLETNSNFFLTPRPFSVIIQDRFNEK